MGMQAFGNRSIDVIAGTVTLLLDAVGESGAGSSFKVLPRHRQFYLVDTGSGNTTILEHSYDEITWFPLATKTASAAFNTAEPCLFIRGNVSVYNTGAITLAMVV